MEEFLGYDYIVTWPSLGSLVQKMKREDQSVAYREVNDETETRFEFSENIFPNKT